MILLATFRLRHTDLNSPFSAGVRLFHVAEEVQIVGMPAHQTDITTIDELLALPEDGMRHELLDGEHVVTPSPRLDHQVVVGDTYWNIRNVLDDRDDLQLFTSPADVVLGPQTLVQPDLFVDRRVAARPAALMINSALNCLFTPRINPYPRHVFG